MQLLNDVLDFSKIEEGRMTIEPMRSSVRQVLDEVAALMGPLARAKGLAFVVEGAPGVPATLVTDPTRLRQILVNLTANAIKFTERGGVRLAVAVTDIESDDRRIRFGVHDTGIGLTPQAQATLFEPFVQGDASMTRRFGGSGLGLAISRRLTAMLGGDIEARSLPGGGSTFTFSLPCGPGATPSSSLDMEVPVPTSDAGTGAPLQARILLAEDTLDSQRVLAVYLRKAGAQVEVASDGREACILATKSPLAPFDLILMDMQMPVLDGYSATSELRRQGCRVPILAITAHALEGQRERCVRAGCDDVATKPIDRATLIQTVRRWLPRGKTEPRPAPARSGASERDEIAALTACFLDGLPSRVDALVRGLDAGDVARVSMLAHQLKGAAGLYGFPTLSNAAAALEQCARTASQVDELVSRARTVVDLCERAHLADPGVPRPSPLGIAP
jgi:CheY-like chemotaxis protein/HPt (histidine-containing phosphotransfer) domain-containing protein